MRMKLNGLLSTYVSGSILKGNFNSLKHVKGVFLFDEDRRSTYMQFLESANERESPVLTTIHSERKQLMAVCIVLLMFTILCFLKFLVSEFLMLRFLWAKVYAGISSGPWFVLAKFGFNAGSGRTADRVRLSKKPSKIFRKCWIYCMESCIS